jgi:hypothetical protein
VRNNRRQCFDRSASDNTEVAIALMDNSLFFDIAITTPTDVGAICIASNNCISHYNLDITHKTHLAKSRNDSSGHSLSTKASCACEVCHTRKSESLVSPEVRTSKSTGGQSCSGTQGQGGQLVKGQQNRGDGGQAYRGAVLQVWVVNPFGVCYSRE